MDVYTDPKDNLLMYLDDIVAENLYISVLNNIKYFHNNNAENNYVIARSNSNLEERNLNIFTLNKDNKISYNYPTIDIILDIYIDECSLCNKSYQYTIKPGNSIKLGNCPYYVNAAKKIQNRWKFIKKIQTLRKIDQYYKSKKYYDTQVFRNLYSLELQRCLNRNLESFIKEMNLQKKLQ